MPGAVDVIDLAEEDEDELYESMEVPDDIEAIEAIPVAGPSRQRNGSGQGRRTSTAGLDSTIDGFDARQEVKMEMAKIDAEVCSPALPS